MTAFVCSTGVAHDFNNILGAIQSHAEVVIEYVDSSHLLDSDLMEVQATAYRSVEITRQLLAFARK